MSQVPTNVMDVRSDYRGRAFTSDLSGQEFWLVVDKGYIPMGLVLGNCVYSMGALHNLIANARATFRGELKEYSEIMYEARELALARMRFQADQLGADGIIGIDIQVQPLHESEWMEVTAMGTAVRHTGSYAHTPPTSHGHVVIPTN